ncbi:T9SS type A sorting domain-containing protein [Phaeocystidibacter luteus]|uniref:T9SS type A sorting domain-containing protein n=1 Tax=Phaeocystidibacter luteus TaxID=911197 RepID=A0A6N6RF99_9FLAO|nr:T9SS type A sorting domain-containing protein [Phaeocystidibacter luteus]KAB2805370.1 T9SS type A sorting domain-containing protein [Phaeocystidibacter luteus]
MHRSRLLLLSSILIGAHTFAQNAPNPGGVQAPTTWMAQEDALSTIGNYHSFNLEQALDASEMDALSLQGSSTVFMVIQPNENPSGTLLFHLGDVAIFDDHVEMRGESMSTELKKGEPTLLTYQIQRPSHYALRTSSSYDVHSSSAFEIGELIIFDGILSREQLRKVNSYLALKYSVTITENDKAQWRDYWTPENGHYWDTRIDRLYKERVIGLGRSDAERFYQTQTVTTKGDALWLSLGSIADEGTMPASTIDDESFVIFSEKDSKVSTASSCRIEDGVAHPLSQWKFQLQNWSSDESTLILRVKSVDRVELKDSLFLYDGTVVQYLPLVGMTDGFWKYEVDLSNLQDFRHYFFTTNPQMECEDESIEVIDNQIVVNERGMSAWDVEVQSLTDGSTVLNRVNGSSTSRFATAGQYVVSILDTNGNYRMMQVVSIGEESVEDIALSGPELKIYPNPIERGREATLEINDLPEMEGDVSITVTDARGRIMSQSEREYSPNIVHPVRLNMPGIYTVIVRQGNSAYSLKHIVRTSN